MIRSPTDGGSWENAAERWSRLAEANRRAEEEWLRSLPLEESLAIFEDLSEGIPEIEPFEPPDDPPVPLFKIWRG